MRHRCRRCFLDRRLLARKFLSQVSRSSVSRADLARCGGFVAHYGGPLLPLFLSHMPFPHISTLSLAPYGSHSRCLHIQLLDLGEQGGFHSQGYPGGRCEAQDPSKLAPGSLTAEVS